LLAIAAGTVVTAISVGLLKTPLNKRKNKEEMI
ncbi:hypothetical protein, partial [Listeria seeligeri]